MTEQPTTTTDPNASLSTIGSDKLDHGSWAVVAAAVTGTSHAESGLPCQDAVAWWSSPPESTRHLLVATAAEGFLTDLFSDKQKCQRNSELADFLASAEDRTEDDKFL